MWLTCIFMTLILVRKMWPTFTPKVALLTLFDYMGIELSKRTKLGNMVGGISMTVVTLFMITIVNHYGLSPYTFSITRHIAVNLGVAIVVWTTGMLIRVSFNFPATVAHLVPLGSLWYLTPFLCVVELLSILIRPFTLAVRLTANLRTGHILIALMGGGMVSSPFIMRLLVTVVGIMYCLFEIAVCTIQGYIFALLPTLYTDEHPS